MPKIRIRIRDQIAFEFLETLVSQSLPYVAITDEMKEAAYVKADKILAIPELAVVDREAELPTFERGTTGYAVVFGMKKEGWVKIVEELL